MEFVSRLSLCTIEEKMKKLVLISVSIILIGCNNQNMKEVPVIKVNEICNSLKKGIQENFSLKNFSKAIELFIEFEDCYADKAVFLNKLALFYKANGQEELAKTTFDLSIKKLDELKELPNNKVAIQKAGIYMIMNEKSKAMEEIRKIDKSKLTESQKEEVIYLEIFASQGEFITTEFNVEFELFDDLREE